MPELPEVETICKSIATVINEKTITDVFQRRTDLRWSLKKEIRSELLNKKLGFPKRIGKYILIPIESEKYLLFHLGMSGRIRIHNNCPKIEKHDHFLLCLDNKTWLIYNDTRRFGFIDLLKKENISKHFLLKNLGVDALSKKLNINLLKKFLTQRKSNIKSLLLNQNIISGIGNIYCNEILFKAKILPMRSSNQIKGNDLRKLLFSIKEILTAAIELGGTTIKDHINPNGDIGYFKQKLNVYGRGAELCRFCHEKIIEIKISGRSTFYCQNCQK